MEDFTGGYFADPMYFEDSYEVCNSLVFESGIINTRMVTHAFEDKKWLMKHLLWFEWPRPSMNHLILKYAPFEREQACWCRRKLAGMVSGLVEICTELFYGAAVFEINKSEDKRSSDLNSCKTNAQEGGIKGF